MAQDFLLNEDGSFPLQDTIINGVYQDTPYGDSDNQSKIDNIFADKGWWKQFPTIGFGINNYDNAEFSQAIFSSLKESLLKDGFTCLPMSIQKTNEGFSVNTAYIQ